jgi:hypothetical protein
VTTVQISLSISALCAPIRSFCVGSIFKSINVMPLTTFAFGFGGQAASGDSATRSGPS